jgi:hypothetical protein
LRFIIDGSLQNFDFGNFVIALSQLLGVPSTHIEIITVEPRDTKIALTLKLYGTPGKTIIFHSCKSILSIIEKERSSQVLASELINAWQNNNPVFENYGLKIDSIEIISEEEGASSILVIVATSSVTIEVTLNRINNNIYVGAVIVVVITIITISILVKKHSIRLIRKKTSTNDYTRIFIKQNTILNRWINTRYAVLGYRFR